MEVAITNQTQPVQDETILSPVVLSFSAAAQPHLLMISTEPKSMLLWTIKNCMFCMSLRVASALFKPITFPTTSYFLPPDLVQDLNILKNGVRNFQNIVTSQHKTTESAVQAIDKCRRLVGGNPLHCQERHATAIINDRGHQKQALAPMPPHRRKTNRLITFLSRCFVRM